MLSREYIKSIDFTNQFDDLRATGNQVGASRTLLKVGKEGSGALFFFGFFWVKKFLSWTLPQKCGLIFHMAKIISGKTIITIQNANWGTTVYEANHVALSSTDEGRTYQLVTSGAKQSSEPWAGASKEPQKTEPSAHEKKVQEHTGALLDVLKGVETNRLNAAIRREYLEAELADKERSNRAAMRLAVFNATQAGVSEEEVTRRMRDDHANYVADIYDLVRTETDLDTPTPVL